MLAELVREVAESRSVTESAIELIRGLRQKLSDLATAGLNEAALTAQVAALAAELQAQQDLLAAAMITGTVADVAQPPPDNGIAAAPNVEPVPAPAEAIAVEAVAVEAAQPEPNV